MQVLGPVKRPAREGHTAQPLKPQADKSPCHAAPVTFSPPSPPQVLLRPPPRGSTPSRLPQAQPPPQGARRSGTSWPPATAPAHTPAEVVREGSGSETLVSHSVEKRPGSEASCPSANANHTRQVALQATASLPSLFQVLRQNKPTYCGHDAARNGHIVFAAAAPRSRKAAKAIKGRKRYKTDNSPSP